MIREHNITILTLSVASLSYLLDEPLIKRELPQVYKTTLGSGIEEKVS
jgi:hypothetical protein